MWKVQEKERSLGKKKERMGKAAWRGGEKKETDAKEKLSRVGSKKESMKCVDKALYLQGDELPILRVTDFCKLSDRYLNQGNQFILQTSTVKLPFPTFLPPASIS